MYYLPVWFCASVRDPVLLPTCRWPRLSPPRVQKAHTGTRRLVGTREGRVTQDGQLCRGCGQKRTGSVACHGQIDNYLSNWVVQFGSRWGSRHQEETLGAGGNPGVVTREMAWRVTDRVLPGFACSTGAWILRLFSDHYRAPGLGPSGKRDTFIIKQIVNINQL